MILYNDRLGFRNALIEQQKELDTSAVSPSCHAHLHNVHTRDIPGAGLAAPITVHARIRFCLLLVISCFRTSGCKEP
jgi:hypothetical protein